MHNSPFMKVLDPDLGFETFTIGELCIVIQFGMLLKVDCGYLCHFCNGFPLLLGVKTIKNQILPIFRQILNRYLDFCSQTFRIPRLCLPTSFLMYWEVSNGFPLHL